ncbi:MAG: hypothetical protein Kow0069_13130 [Promethearchaeota archaeon]
MVGRTINVVDSRASAIVRQRTGRSPLWWAPLVNGCLAVAAVAIFLTNPGRRLDFKTFYNAGAHLFHDPARLYDDYHFYHDLVAFPYRYLPGVAALLYPLSLLDLRVAFVAWTAGSFSATWWTSKILVAACEADAEAGGAFTSVPRETVTRHARLYLLLPAHAANFVLGQVDAFAGLLLLLGFRALGEERNARAGLFLGAAVAVKPVFLVVAPFLVSFDRLVRRGERADELRRAGKALAGAAIPLGMAVLPFVLSPGLFGGFLKVNFSRIQTSHSFSLTQVILSSIFLAGMDGNDYATATLLAVAGPALAVALWAHVRSPPSKSPGGLARYLLRALAGTWLLFVAYYDAWGHHLVYAAPVVTLVLLMLPGGQWSGSAGADGGRSSRGGTGAGGEGAPAWGGAGRENGSKTCPQDRPPNLQRVASRAWFALNLTFWTMYLYLLNPWFLLVNLVNTGLVLVLFGAWVAGVLNGPAEK